MRQRLPFDIYTILIIAIVPVFLITAGALTWNHSRVEKKELCANARTWLADVGDLAPAYTDAGALRSTTTWLSQLEAVGNPGAADDLRSVLLNAISYAMNTDPGLKTTGTGEVYDTLRPFQRSIDDAQATLVTDCPDTSSLIPTAFPMFFRQGEP